MRAVVLAGSTAVHVVVLWWLAAQPAEPAHPRRQTVTRHRARVNAPAATPIEIELVTGGTQRSGSLGKSLRRARSNGSIVSGADKGGDEAAVPSAASSSASSSGSPLMRMRDDRPDFRLGSATAERIAAAGSTGPRDEVRRSGRLESQPGGRAVVRDTVTTMTVDRDGGVTFRDKPTLDVKARAPMGALLDPEFRREVNQHVAKWLEDPYEGTRYGPSQDLPNHLQAVPGACDTWGSDFCQDPLAPDFEKRLRAIRAKLRGGISGTFDVTDLVDRKRGGDPYASRKMKLLDDTRDERVEMAERHRAQQRARSSELVLRNLERLWIEELDPVVRRALLFELWDECGEDDAGMRARTIVIDWIRARLPRGSQHAFSDDEIGELRARSTSTAAFVPYE